MSIDKMRDQFVEWLKTQSHVLNVGFNKSSGRFILPEDETAWQAWLASTAATEAEIDQLKAENEVLLDDLEQAKYDADAWRNQEESVWIQVFLGEGDDPFISAVQGAICIEQLALMQSDLLAYAEDYFEHGAGLYVFDCRHCKAHYDNVGMTEPEHWEMDFSEYARFPWADEQDAERDATGNGEQA
ncbi:MAG: hypothetical protein ACRESJ_22300 [Pseudomonas sp.]|uniref:hypothetical protein n=1 Tax=Pseudomonas sp. TaxID=306 RepID=UPI003D6F9490